MQKVCWESCCDLRSENKKLIGSRAILENYDTTSIFGRLSQDAGLPIYQKVAAGPQSRNAKRSLRDGGVAEIY